MKISDIPVTGPPDEQKICVKCGFCCDGTVFLHAHLEPGERGIGGLPEWIEKNSITEDGKDYFPLPCHYFSMKCTIYEQKRANVCGSYRCQLLKDLKERKIAPDDALGVVREAASMRHEIIREYLRISNENGDINFRQILLELGKVQKSVSGEESLSIDHELLLARCNIFEALLIKHFRSTDDFEKIIMK